MAKSFKSKTSNFNEIRGLAGLQAAMQAAMQDETRKADKRRANARKANRASQIARGIDPDKGKTDRSIHQDPRGYVGAAPTKDGARVVVKAPQPESDSRIKSLAVDAARGERGARSKLERAVVALPKGRRVGAAVDAAREQVREERAKAREAAKHTRHAAKMQCIADEALRKAQTESAYYETGRVQRRERNKALYAAYFAAKKAEAVKTPGVYAWTLPRFEKPTAGMLAHDKSTVGKLLYNCECWAR